ncbi:MAG: hypothetical protein IAE78_13500 [Myxococcus sp.]|nr:hypothetical protein [Myxococcus sp.]
MRLFVAALALAYVMPTYSILRRYAATRDELTLTSLKVDGTGAVAPAMAREVASALGTSWTSGDLPLQTSLSIKYPGRCRLELSSFDAGKTMVVASSNGKRRTEGPELAAAQVALEELCALFAVKSAGEGETRASIDRHLSALKVDTKLVSHARFLGQLAFAIGNRADGNAQYWVYRDRTGTDRFMPARVRFTDERGAWDVRFIDYSSASVADWLPRVVEVYRGEELHLRLTALNADTRADLEKTKF